MYAKGKDSMKPTKRKSEESPERASKRSRTSQSLSADIRQPFSGPSSSDDSFVTAYTASSDKSETLEDARRSTSSSVSTEAKEKTTRKRKSEESPERASKRSRTSQSLSEDIRQPFSGPSSSDADSFVKAYTASSDKSETLEDARRSTSSSVSTEAKEKTTRKRKSEESPERASKRSRTSQSLSKDIRQPFSGPSSSDADSFVKAYTASSDKSETLEDARRSTPSSVSTEAKEKTTRKRKSEESPERASKRSRTSQSLSEDIRQPFNGPSSSDADSVVSSLRRTSENTEGSSSSFILPSCSEDEESDYPGPYDSKCDFLAKYEEKELLGIGGYGSVFAGYRKVDNMPVAIKHIRLPVRRTTVCLKGEDVNLPVEVALLLKLQEGKEEISEIAALLDWYDLDDAVILILERPIPCMDLKNYITSNKPFVQEQEAKIITKQLVDCLIELHSRNVLHRDIKAENILIETGSDVLRPKLIDFGCGRLLSEEKGKKYHTYYGTSLYVPPEWVTSGWYTAEGTTVWQLGVVLFEMLHGGKMPFQSRYQTRFCDPKLRDSLSNDCQDFILSCLNKTTGDRLNLEALKNHPWLMPEPISQVYRWIPNWTVLEAVKARLRSLWLQCFGLYSRFRSLLFTER